VSDFDDLAAEMALAEDERLADERAAYEEAEGRARYELELAQHPEREDDYPW